ncbi:MAG: Mur ligase family protein [Hyphomicrobiaceae bacterium]
MNSHQRIRDRLTDWRNRWSRRRNKATFIGVTGSSGKTTCAELLTGILEAHGPVISQIKDNTVTAISKKIRRCPQDAAFAVFEAGVGQKGQMEPMARLIQPTVAVVTMVGLEHYHFFRNKEAIALEKGALVEAIRPDGLAILNADDPYVMSMAERTTARIVTFGREAEADYRVVSASAAYPDCLLLVINCRGTERTFQTRFAGDQFWLSCVAAIAVAMELGVPIDIIQKQVSKFEGSKFRFQPLATSGPTFILDTIKAPVGTLALAFSAFEDCNFPHKRIVLGPLSDYSGTSKTKYRDAYRAARAVADQVIVVDRHLHRYEDVVADLASGKLIEFETPEQVNQFIRETFRKDEIILLKGSGNLHLERIALSWEIDINCWEPKCGRGVDCLRCSFNRYPFDTHKQVERERKQRQGLTLLKPRNRTIDRTETKL